MQKKTNKQSNRFHNNLNKVLHDNNYLSSRRLKRQAQVGYQTRADRNKKIPAIFNDLAKIGYQLPRPSSFKEKHAFALVAYWQSKGLDNKTINCRLSMMRTVAHWVGKTGMIKESGRYYANPEDAVVHVVNQQDKSFTQNGVDPIKVINTVLAEDINIGASMLAALAYGLRFQEACQIRPHVTIQDFTFEILTIDKGTKGGLTRILPMETPFQRDVLEFLKSLAPRREASVIPHDKTLKQYCSRFRYLMGKHGVTKKGLGVTMHGLRHEYINDRYKELIGFETAIRGQQPGEVTDEADKYARRVIMQEVGHSRTCVFSAYGGNCETSKPDFSKISREHALAKTVSDNPDTSDKQT